MGKHRHDNDEVIRNGTRYRVSATGSKGVFPRDLDRLYHQYENLRLAVYNQYKDYFPDVTSQKELQSYIDEQFIRLVMEYDTAGEVDQPYYFKQKLNLRVKNSYIKGEFRDRDRVFVCKNDFDITNLVEDKPYIDEEFDYYVVIEDILSDVSLSDIEAEILKLILKEESDNTIVYLISRKFPEETSTQIEITLKELKSFLKERLTKDIGGQ